MEQDESRPHNTVNYKITRSIRLIKLEKFIKWLQMPKIQNELEQEHADEYNDKLAYFEAYLQKYEEKNHT